MKTIRIGIFGYCRGEYYVDNILANNGKIVAVCDKRKERLDKARSKLGNMATYHEDFDSFIEQDMDAVLLTNYFHEHTAYAIRCLERNINVLSECTSNSTMAEGVKLCEAAEKSKARFMLAENYPYMLFNQEMKRVYDMGKLGKCLYAEGEYNHAGNFYGSPDRDPWNDIVVLFDGEHHWRCHLPRTYYVTHSLAPLMYATGANPIRVTAMPVYHPAPTDCDRASYVGDRAAIITTLNDDDSVFKFTGCAAFGASDNSYRLCCDNGQIENVRGTNGKIMLRYNEWSTPEGEEPTQFYMPQWPAQDKELIEKAGHGGGDFCVVREFFKALREDRQHPFDVYFATRMASVAILGHRSLMQYGVPYDIPDFRKKEDRDKFRDDNISPFYHLDGRTPTCHCCSHPDYKPSQQQIENFRSFLK